MDRPAALPPDIWERTPPAAQAYRRALEARVAALEGLMQALQGQLHQPARNSARPPANAPPQRMRLRRPRRHRRRGGHPGHPGHTRTLVPVEDVHEVVGLKPPQCPPCPTSFAGDAPTPWRHPVMEMPPIRPMVTEYQWHHRVCVACGQATRASWPTGVPSGTYGPASKRQSRCIRGRIVCRSAQPRRRWRRYAACR